MDGDHSRTGVSADDVELWMFCDVSQILLTPL